VAQGYHSYSYFYNAVPGRTAHTAETHNDIVHIVTFTLQSLAEQPIKERPTMVTECEPLVIVHHEAMGDVDIEPLSLLDSLVQLLRSNITINAMLHNTTPSSMLLL